MIFHLTFAADWEAGRAAGEYRLPTRDRTLDEVGFTHCSFENQVDRVAEAGVGISTPWSRSNGTSRNRASRCRSAGRQSLRQRTTRNMGTGPASGCAASWRARMRGLGPGSATSSIVRW